MQRSLTEIAIGCDTDKAQSPRYIGNFERHFGPLRDKPIKILEIGVFKGGALLMWHEYFPRGLVVGLDINTPPIAGCERIRIFQGSQDDKALLDRIAAECAPDGFDIVIDDASHIGQLTRASFRNLFERHVKPGGVYVVEDWGTGYWEAWPDGKKYRVTEDRYLSSSSSLTVCDWILRKLGLGDKRSVDPAFSAHNFGMVGFVKELIDEVAWADVTAPNRGNPELGSRASSISEMTIYSGHAFIVKARESYSDVGAG